MVKITIFVEGGGDSKELQARCREGFRKLLENCGYEGRMLKIVACGARNAAFEDFRNALRWVKGREFVAMMIDSEQPLGNLEATWQHLAQHDRWQKPSGVLDAQVLFMTTCMETWIVADHSAMKKHYGHALKVAKLPPLQELETRDRHDVLDSLERATQDCSNAYRKGKRSFAVLATLSPDTLQIHLPSFARTRRILDERL